MARFQDPEPLSHVPDPAKRYPVMLMVRGGVPFINVLDVDAGKDLDVDVVSALGVAADIIMEVQRLALMLNEQAEELLDAELAEKFPEHELRRLRNLWRKN